MPEHDRDYFRDTRIRYLGYANEVGESFRGLAPLRLVRASYAVAFGYVLADTADKSWKMFRTDWNIKNVGIAAGDALIWQTLASVVIPGLVINRVCAYTHHRLLKQASKVPLTGRKIITAGVGLACIPLIVFPIDNVVSLLMTLTYRKWLHET